MSVVSMRVPILCLPHEEKGNVFSGTFSLRTCCLMSLAWVLYLYGMALPWDDVKATSFFALSYWHTLRASGLSAKAES